MFVPQHLAQNHAQGERQGEPVAQFEIGPYQNFVYLLLDWTEKKAALIDPQQDLSKPLECIKFHGFEWVATLITHTHGDHTAGLPMIVQSYPEIPIFVHSQDLHRLTREVLDSGKIQPVKNNDLIPIGTLEVEVLHTPGHSIGECCYFVKGQPPYLFSGDTLFIRDCGRTDLDTGSTEQMFQSLQNLKKLPKNCIILPGHHYQSECASLLEKELRENPALQCTSISELTMLP